MSIGLKRSPTNNTDGESRNPKAQKARLSEALSKAIVVALDCPSFDVYVGIEDGRPADWMGNVHEPDIRSKPHTTI
jgi:phenylpyruvate tautomerase PptA (4-oxalocrotonate tautomerase family)